MSEMATLAKKSILNPLATCFIPTNLRNFNKDVKAEPAKNVKAQENSNDLEITKKLDSSLKSTYLDQRKESPTEDVDTENKAMALFSLPTPDTGILPQEKGSESKPYAMEALAICHLILLVALDVFYKQFYEDKRCDILPTIKEIEETEEECQCPPMFGWVLPSTFFGNPLKLKYKCSKDRVHATLHCGKSVNASCLPVKNAGEKNAWEAYNIDVCKTLEQCWLEFEMIIQDVCNTVRLDDPLIEVENSEDMGSPKTTEADELKGFVKPKSERTSIEPESSIWNDVAVDQALNDLKIVDDGSHPLLQPVNSNYLNEGDLTEDYLVDVEKMLERCLSPSTEFGAFNSEVKTNSSSRLSIADSGIEDPLEDFEKILEISSGAEYDASGYQIKGHSVCSPPCSVWCDRVPSSVKKTYVNFIKRSNSFDYASETKEKRKCVVERHSYKRSLSADDAKYTNFNRGLSATSESGSKESLIFRKDPIAFFKTNRMLKDGARQYRSYSDLSDCNLRENTCNSMERSNSWGPFDGADSLWKPLPDCGSSEDNPKYGSHKRFRDTRRQRSVN